MKSLLILAAVAVAGPVSAARHNSGTNKVDIPPDVQAALTTDGRKLVDAVRDPDSVRLRNVHVTAFKSGSGRAICGEINGTNLLGGMPGFSEFFISDDGNVFISGTVVAGDDVSVLVDPACGGKLYPLEPRDYTMELKAAFNAAKGQ